MKTRYGAWLGILLLSLPSLVGFGPPKLVESDRELLPLYPGGIASVADAAPPALHGTAALIMDTSSGQVAYDRNGYARVAPASITKLMTALVAVDRAKLTDKVTIKADYLVDGSAMGILPGEELTVEDLLWGMLLPSGNDAAQSLAAGLGGGSADRFVGWMNERARAMGLHDTHFRNPHGLDEDDHYSTPYDIALMARAVLANPKLAQMVSTRTQSVRAGRRVYFLVNSNKLLGDPSVPGVDGVKTGFTDSSGDSLVASATRDGHQLIAVAMGTNMERAAVAGALLNYAFRAYAWIDLGPPRFSLWKSASDRVQTASLAAARQQMVARWLLPYLRTAVDMSAASAPDKAQVAGGPAGLFSYAAGAAPLLDLPLYLRDGRDGG